jgi:enoyl-CoA hydratase
MDGSVVKLEREQGVAVITIDDGKANALSADVLAAVNGALDSVETEDAPAVVICGRDGMFSGGFDLKVRRGGDPSAIGDLVTTGGELVLRLYSSPRPVVCACTGHAVAAGALIALGSHLRIGADGDFRIGLIETTIGMVLPDWALLMAQERVSRTHLQRALVEGLAFGPAEAREAGFLDLVAPPDQVRKLAVHEAARLGGLDRAAYAGNAAKLRDAGIARLGGALAADRAALSGSR